MTDQSALYLWDQDKADRRLAVKLTASTLVKLGVLVAAEPTDRICTVHLWLGAVASDECITMETKKALGLPVEPCVMVDVVRVSDD